jgi:hypothetical protein
MVATLTAFPARPPFALERLSVIRDADGRITHIRYVMPRHKAANWVGPGRKRKSTQLGANGVIELSPFEFLDRLADLIPQPRKHRHRYHGVFAPNHPLRPAVTALAVGNVGKQRDAAPSPPLPLGEGRGERAPNHDKPRSHDTSRIAWAKYPGIRFPGRGSLGMREQPAHEPLIRRATLAEVPLTGLSFILVPPIYKTLIAK